MSRTFCRCAIALITVFNLAQLEAVTVNPIAHLCPTNKIAPHRRVARYDRGNPRTFREFYNLLTPDTPSNLQEKPQEDDPDDCGYIEDYDENDVGSVTQQATRRQGHKHHNHLLSGTQFLLNQHQHNGIKPPPKPSRPPPAGYFGNNNYTPPKPLQPTDYVKPVAEPSNNDAEVIYTPGLVGGPIGHIIGRPQNQGSRPYSEKVISHRKPKYQHHQTPPKPNSNTATESHPRPRKYVKDSGIIGSFVDLFF